MKPYKFTKNKLDSNTIKYKFEKPDGNKLTQNELIELLKSENKEFLKTFTDSLNNSTQEFSGAYFWKCPPISKQTLNKKFEFVTIKSTALDNATQNYSSYQQYINNNLGKSVCSFPNLSNDAILTLPLPEANKDFKNISTFTKNASEKQQQEFWKEVATKLSEEIEKNNGPRWLNTHGLGIDYLHVRIDQKPKYYGNYEEYKNPNYAPTPLTPREKIIANLDKVCLEPAGGLANAELLKNKTFQNKNDYLPDSQPTETYQVKIEGEMIDLKAINQSGWLEELRKTLISYIKLNIKSWKIEQEGSTEILINKSGTKCWKWGFSQNEWKEIENSFNNDKKQKTERKWYNPIDYPLPWIITVLSFTLLIVITMIFWKRTKKKS